MSKEEHQKQLVDAPAEGKDDEKELVNNGQALASNEAPALEDKSKKNEDEEINQEQNGEEGAKGCSDSNGGEVGQRRDSIDSGKQSGDHQKKPNIISGRKCFNKLCNSKKIYKKIRSRVENAKYRFLCKSCYENYSNNFYCEFCQQIYSNYANQEDDLKWIGCDTCQRWNHIECQKKYRDKNITQVRDKQFIYQCLSCFQKARNNPPPPNQEYNKYKYKNQRAQEGKRLSKSRLEINKEDRTLMFHKKLENLTNLEGFLQTYNFRLCLHQGLIRQDIDNLRNSSKKSQSEEKQKNKKVKLN